jgi:hypothetical protein
MTTTPVDLNKIRAAKQADSRDDVLETAKQIRLTNDTSATPTNNPDADADAAFKAYQSMAALLLEQDIALQDTAYNLMVLLGDVLQMVGCASCRGELHYQILRDISGILETAMQEAAEFDEPEDE